MPFKTWPDDTICHCLQPSGCLPASPPSVYHIVAFSVFGLSQCVLVMPHCNVWAYIVCVLHLPCRWYITDVRGPWTGAEIYSSGSPAGPMQGKDNLQCACSLPASIHPSILARIFQENRKDAEMPCISTTSLHLSQLEHFTFHCRTIWQTLPMTRSSLRCASNAYCVGRRLVTWSNNSNNNT